MTPWQPFTPEDPKPEPLPINGAALAWAVAGTAGIYFMFVGIACTFASVREHWLLVAIPVLIAFTAFCVRAYVNRAQPERALDDMAEPEPIRRSVVNVPSKSVITVPASKNAKADLLEFEFHQCAIEIYQRWESPITTGTVDLPKDGAYLEAYSSEIKRKRLTIITRPDGLTMQDFIQIFEGGYNDLIKVSHSSPSPTPE